MPLPLDRPPQMLVNSYVFETLCPENVSENTRSRLACGSGKSVHVSVVNSHGEGQSFGSKRVAGSGEATPRERGRFA